jgi:hypothetical protein
VELDLGFAAMGDEPMSVAAFYQEIGIELPDKAGAWLAVPCLNPDHDDRRPSCGVNTTTGGFKCQSCDAKGSAYDAAVLVGRTKGEAGELAKRYGLFHEGQGGRASPRSPATLQPPTGNRDSEAESEGLQGADPDLG